MWRLSKEIITLKMLMYEKLKIQMKIMYMQRFQNIHQSSDYIKGKKVFGFFYDALKGRQVITYNKIFKRISKKKI